MPSESVGLSVGYRIFTYAHAANRSGLKWGSLLHFNVPKLPFIFPEHWLS